MKLAGLLQRERSAVAVVGTTTFNAPGIYYPPYGKSVFLLSGKGTPGNATVPGNISGSNTYSYSTYVPASGGNVAAYYPATGGNVSGDNSYSYSTYVPASGGNYAGETYGGANYGGQNPASGGNYAGTNPATGGNYANTNPPVPITSTATVNYGSNFVQHYRYDYSYQTYYYNSSFNYYTSYADPSGYASGTFPGSNPNLYNPCSDFVSYYNVKISTATNTVTNGYNPGTANYNPVVPGNPYYNPYYPATPYYVPYNVPYYNPYTPAYTYNTYVPGNPNYNTYYPAYSNYNTYYPAYTYNTTVPGNPNYNPTVPGNTGTTYNVLGITLPGGPSDTSAPVIGYSIISVDYTTAGVPISVPPGGYVAIQNKYPGT
jgi:hypothetical protein